MSVMDAGFHLLHDFIKYFIIVFCSIDQFIFNGIRCMPDQLLINAATQAFVSWLRAAAV